MCGVLAGQDGVQERGAWLQLCRLGGGEGMFVQQQAQWFELPGASGGDGGGSRTGRAQRRCSLVSPQAAATRGASLLCLSARQL